MNHKKEKLLIEYKQSAPSSCLCCQILELKRGRLFAHYEILRERLEKQKADNKNFQRTLAMILKTGNKLRAIKEAIREVKDTENKLANMFEVEINGKTFFRLNENSDRRRSCVKKVQYDSEQSAEIAVIEMEHRLDEDFEAYKCRHCEFWHVGHSV